MNDNSVKLFTREETAALLPYSQLVQSLFRVCQEYEHGELISPERMVVPFPQDGVMLSMPAVAPDISINKLVNVVPGNRNKGIATINGHVSVFDTVTGRPLMILDGPETTGRRTAAVSMLGVQVFSPQPEEFLLIGTGIQSGYHLQAIAELYPGARVWIKGISEDKTKTFCDEHADLHSTILPWNEPHPPETASVIITLTTSKVAFLDVAARKEVLIIGVGAFKPEMAEISARTLRESQVFLDDPVGARHEAGDIIQAQLNWNDTSSLYHAITTGFDCSKPVVFKTVGTGAWDLAAARLAAQLLNNPR